ncbi:ATP-binding protein [Pseudoalteromonas sp. CnMc7-37]|uniref:ATP-binding protein n=1 Tax=Pseudoalteromonas sp. CnMc7-37 TaxID=2954496 RepID=UPI0020981BE7|nr:ATP-binding protein [Pseudoalteromonas sp. CnMc7-37]MCO7206064.1 ATP-binding protein [Pseudoalteromonas sp. CnMc7-37]
MKLRASVILYFALSMNSAFASTLQQNIDEARTISDYQKRYDYLKAIDKKLIESASLAEQVSYNVRLIHVHIHLGQFQQAQTIIDELEAGPKYKKDSPIYSELYLAKARLAYRKSDLETAIYLSQQNVALFQRLQLTHYEIDAVASLVSAYHNAGEYQAALNLLEVYIHDNNRELTLKQKEMLYHGYSRNLEQLDRLTLALEYKLKRREVIHQMSPSISLQAGISYSIAQSYLDLEQYEKAKSEFIIALSFDRQTGSLSDIGHSLVKLSQCEYGLKNYDAALEYAQEAQQVFASYNSARNTAWANHNIAINLLEVDKATQALTIEKQVITELKQDDHLYIDVLLTLAKLYIGSTEHEQAKHFAEQAYKLSNQKNKLQKQITALEHLITVAVQQADYKQALSYQRTITELEKGFARNNYNQRLAELQNSIAMRDRDLAIQDLKLQDNEKSQAIASQRQTILYSILLFSLLLAVMGIALLRIRQRKQLIEQRRNYLDKQISQRSKLLSQVAHELSGPLTGLRLHLETLQAGLTQFNELTYEKLNQKITDMATLVTDLNKISLLEQSSFQLNVTTLNAAEYFQSLHADMAIQLDKFEVRFSQNVADELNFECDATRLSQLFANLISNSLKYTNHPGKINLTISQNQTQLLICYEDSAPGVSDESLAKIFDHLYRVPDLKTVKQSGSGIGLAIVKQIVEAHNWRITAAHSELGGVRYDLTIPI